MIRFTSGNLLSAPTEALVNTVNTVGVMGKGIALQFKNQYPKNFIAYKEACKSGELVIGKMLVVKDGDLLNKKTIINFPTKVHWKSPSKYEYISLGLVALKEAIADYDLNSIALPPLGCGNGGLDWERVKGLIEKELGSVDADIRVYVPNEGIKTLLQKEESANVYTLTPASAMLLYLMFYYESAGEQSSLFVANKLAYFLQRSGEDLRLNFVAHHYGPYAVQLNHVLYRLNGHYISGLEQNMAQPFDPLSLKYDRLNEILSFVDGRLTDQQKLRLDNVLNLLRGFESAFSLELIATIDFLLAKDHDKYKSIERLHNEIMEWSKRKTEMFDARSISIAYNHLINYRSNLNSFQH